MALTYINCSFCNREYLKDNRHINENRKFGNNSYCSIQCQSLAKNKQKKFFCDNPTCKKHSKKKLSELLAYNFCSRSCAATFNNKGRIRNKAGLNGFPGRYKIRSRYCQYCGNRILYGRNYCSMSCWAKAHELSKEEIINQIKSLSLRLGRPPTRRECKHSTACYKHFGSWNSALIAAGLAPHRSLNQRMYKRRKCFASDGHLCDSVSELLIDNWLYSQSISHQKEVSYPRGKFTADWAIFSNTLVEYFGLANDSRRYDQEIQKKRQICQEFNIKLIEIYSKDLFPKNLLDQVF